MAIALGLLILVSSLAIAVPAQTMSEHGASVNDFQFAGTAAKAERIREDFGESGRRAAWWFLGLELPFLLGFGLLLSAGGAFAARRLAEVGAVRLARVGVVAAVFGLAAAACDLVQNLALASVLLGHTAQPAPRIAEYFGYLTWVFGVFAGTVFVCGWGVATIRRSGALERS